MKRLLVFMARGIIILLAFLMIISLALRNSVKWVEYKSDKGFSLNHPSSWKIQELAPTDVKYPFGQEYLLIVSDVPFEFPGEDVEVIEKVRIVVSRYPSFSVQGDIEQLADETISRSQGKKFPREYLNLDGYRTIREVFVNSGDASNKKELFYWVNVGDYIYNITGIMLIDRPILLAEYNEYLLRRTISSFTFSR